MLNWAEKSRSVPLHLNWRNSWFKSHKNHPPRPPSSGPGLGSQADEAAGKHPEASAESGEEPRLGKPRAGVGLAGGLFRLPGAASPCRQAQMRNEGGRQVF